MFWRAVEVELGAAAGRPAVFAAVAAEDRVGTGEGNCFWGPADIGHFAEEHFAVAGELNKDCFCRSLGHLDPPLDDRPVRTANYLPPMHADCGLD